MTCNSCVRAYQFRKLGFPVRYGSTIGNMVNNLFRDDLIRVRVTAFVQHRNSNRLEWPWITNLTKLWKNLLGRVLRIRHHQLPPTSFLRRDVKNRAQSPSVFRSCPFVKSCASGWNPWASVSRTSASTTEKVDEVIFKGLKICSAMYASYVWLRRASGR